MVNKDVYCEVVGAAECMKEYTVSWLNFPSSSTAMA